MPKKIDLTGRKFGKLTVIKEAEKKNGKTHWFCLCECGNKSIVDGYKLKSAHTTSCGCARKGANKENLLGLKYNRLTVISEAASKNEKTYWVCLCECGNKTTVHAHSLKFGKTKSCGCAKKGINKKNLLGKKFGRLTVINEEDNRGIYTRWRCRCDCGNTTVVDTLNLNSGHTKSCGCLILKYKKIVIGDKFSRLTVIKKYKGDSCGIKWHCLCDCGTKVITLGKSLKEGNTKSCGCLKKEKNERQIQAVTTHGFSQTEEYNIWRGMIERCENEDNHKYCDYGGRGIAVCERWHVFENFLSDMGKRPSLEHSVDRVNNFSGIYSPENCRWATRKEQGRNKRNNLLITINGVEKCLAEWVELYKADYGRANSRITQLGWDPVKALTVPSLREKH